MMIEKPKGLETKSHWRNYHTREDQKAIKYKKISHKYRFYFVQPDQLIIFMESTLCCCCNLNL